MPARTLTDEDLEIVVGGLDRGAARLRAMAQAAEPRADAAWGTISDRAMFDLKMGTHRASRMAERKGPPTHSPSTR